MLFTVSELNYIPLFSSEFQDIIDAIVIAEKVTESTAWTNLVTRKADEIYSILIGKNGVGSDSEYNGIADGTVGDARLRADIKYAEMYLTAMELVRSKKNQNDDGYISESQMGVSLSKEPDNVLSSKYYKKAMNYIARHYKNGYRRDLVEDYDDY